MRAGVAPAAILLGEADLILAVGAEVAEELYGVRVPVLQLAASDLDAIRDSSGVSTARAARSRGLETLSCPPMTPEFEITPFTADHLDAAAALLAARQSALRAVRPELSARYAEAAGCRPFLEALLAREGSHGVVGMRDGGMIAYLVGFPRFEPIWGRACWSPIEGQAYDASVDPDVMRDLYAIWSQHFVDRGFSVSTCTRRRTIRRCSTRGS